MDTKDVNRATELTPDVEAEIAQMFTYQPWDGAQTTAGTIVRQALAHAVKTIVSNVPPCADRSVAIRKIREARMDCNSAITFRGRY
jgi:hypothetical protein